MEKRMEAVIDQAEETASKLVKSSDQANYLRKRKLDLESKVMSLEEALSKEKEKFEAATYFDLLSFASAVPSAIFNSYGKKVRKCQDNSKSSGFKREKGFCDEMRKFSLTLYSYSKKSYDFLRASLDDCLPHPSTVISWLRKIDGSPGLCQQAFDQLKGIVDKQKMLGQQVTNKL